MPVMSDPKDIPATPKKNGELAGPASDPIPASGPMLQPEGDEYTVELVEFGPTVSVEGVIPPNPEDIALLARRKRNRWILTISCAALFAFGVFLGPVIYRTSKVHFAEVMAQRAEAELDNRHFDEAVASVRSSFQMVPNDPEVLRAMARIISTLDVPGAMVYWNWVLESKTATDRDRRDAAEYALRQNLYSDASDIIQSLLQKNGDDPKNLVLAAKLYSLVGDSSKAMAFATRASLNEPGNKATTIFLALEELKNSYLHQAGVDSLFKVADEDDAYGLIALQRLVSVSNLSPQEIDHVIARLHSHPMGGELQKLSALSLELKRNPSQRNALLKDAVAAHQNASLDDLRQFTNWLNTVNESARVLSLISPQKALADHNLFVVYLDALIALKKWSDLKSILSQPKIPIEPVYEQLYLSRWAEGIGDTQSEELYWHGAELAATHNPRQNLALALYAEKVGRNDRANAIYRVLIQEPIIARVTFAGLLRVNASQDTATLRDILDQMVRRWPMDVVAMDRDIYYNLLLNNRVQDMFQRATLLMKDDPKSLSHRTNVALAYLRLKKPEEALKIYHDVNIQWDHAPTSSLAVYVATLVANGRVVRAHHIFQLIAPDTLRAEERTLIKPLH